MTATVLPPPGTERPLPQIDRLPERLEQRGGSVDLVKAEYLEEIKRAITNHPRSLQTRIGPSELGHPCARRIGYKLLGHPETNHAPDDTPWLPTIGTAVHAWLEDVFTDANTEARNGYGAARWLTELRVDVGEVNGVGVTGSLDLYDRVTATVIDHKIVGATTLRKYKAKGPGDQYRTQIHCYGRGLARRGLPVDNVVIAFLPRNGELSQAHLWHEAYDEQVALDALQRVNGIALATSVLGVEALARLATADAWCMRCPWHRRDSTDPATGCPGDETARIPHTAPPALTFDS